MGGQNKRKEDAVQKPQSDEGNKFASLDNELGEARPEEELGLEKKDPLPSSPRIEGNGSPGKGKSQESKDQPESLNPI